MADTIQLTGSFLLGDAIPNISPNISGGFVHPPDWQGGQLEGADQQQPERYLGAIPANMVQHPDQIQTSQAGAICALYAGDLYDRFYATPTATALGNVLGPKSTDITVWNAFRTQKTLASIIETGVEGVTIVRPDGPEPTNYAPLEEKIYQLEVDNIGPATINYSATFVATAANNPFVTLTGTRIVLFPLEPERPFTERLIFQTSVLEASDGTETRAASRANPRQSFNFQYFMPNTPTSRSLILNKLYGHHGILFAVGMFQWSRRLGAAATIGQTVIQLDTTNADFRDTTTDTVNTIVLWRGPEDFEIAEVALGGLADTQITLALPLAQNHAAGATVVVPLQIALSRDPIEWTETQTNEIILSMGWLTVGDVDLGDISSLATNTDGRPILDSPNLIRSNALVQDIDSGYDLFDPGTGVFDARNLRVSNHSLTRKGFYAGNEADAFELRKVLYGLRGKQKTFWLPTFRDDFTVTQDIGSSETKLIIENTDYNIFVDGLGPWTGLRIVLTDGTVFHRVITGADPNIDPTKEDILFDSSLGQVVTLAEIQRVSLMWISRFDDDNFSIEWEGIGRIAVDLPVRGVPG